MCRLTTAVVVILAGLTLAAPRLKDPPKQATPVVGKWRLVLMNGNKLASSWNAEYFADGSAVRTNDDARPEFRWRYRTDTSAVPARLDYLHDHKPPDLCIFKVEGDTLTVCYSYGEDRSRPKEFGQPSTMELVFKRVKPKD
jgi:uncharacterized protein (TIGR03067 family)